MPHRRPPSRLFDEAMYYLSSHPAPINVHTLLTLHYSFYWHAARRSNAPGPLRSLTRAIFTSTVLHYITVTRFLPKNKEYYYYCRNRLHAYSIVPVEPFIVTLRASAAHATRPLVAGNPTFLTLSDLATWGTLWYCTPHLPGMARTVSDA